MKFKSEDNRLTDQEFNELVLLEKENKTGQHIQNTTAYIDDIQ